MKRDLKKIKEKSKGGSHGIFLGESKKETFFLFLCSLNQSSLFLLILSVVETFLQKFTSFTFGQSIDI